MKKVMILGAGYAGLRALRELQKKTEGFEVTIVDRNSYHFESTDLHEVAAGTQPWEKITYEISDVVNPRMTTFIQDEVLKIDTEKQEVQLEKTGTHSYDYLVVALGFRSETFGIPGAEEFALEMVDIVSARKVYDHILASMDKYKETNDRKYLNIAVCGAGFTGIELVGSLVENKKAFADRAGVKKDDVTIYCVEAAPSILPMFNDELRKYCLDNLAKWDVELMTGKAIKGLKQDTVIYADGEVEKELHAGTIIWTTGVSGSEIIGKSGFEERRGRVMVKQNLTDPAHDNVYLIGDVSAVMDPENNRPYPTTAQIALKMGAHAGRNILLQIAGQPTKDFKFQSLGSVASIGNAHAFGLVGKMNVKGYPASFVKKMIMNKSLMDTGGVKEVMAKGRFDLYR
ncbi:MULTISPECIES: NAD(P)/FAD-dependent oxidoreductase [Enterococcus]|uniref:NADH dehydrogenase n=1 Tax=Enterococcus alcedinis TaxID=1274384 RepID=A0A917JEQ0_9ENTE|nr:NAD(P)/FAD-dependent oxidoreductase [Enterococcus alcedinis]MBP2101853.1 NADH dehydrogenase [Enterococcus alcedinis]GGI65416.1 NADH dehydrogenase [Enterococcus alcedinis]